MSLYTADVNPLMFHPLIFKDANNKLRHTMQYHKPHTFTSTLDIQNKKGKRDDNFYNSVSVNQTDTAKMLAQ